MTSTTTTAISQSRLITLPSGQVIGSPTTRRELKRQTGQERRERRALYRSLRRRGLNYETAGVIVRATSKEQRK